MHKKKTIEQTYKKISHREFILSRPTTYLGDIQTVSMKMFTVENINDLNNLKIIKKDVDYNAGLLKIFELRENVEKKLGSEFDIRQFHDEFLGRGELPLSVLFETFPLLKDKKK